MDILVTQDQGKSPVTVIHIQGDLTTDQELVQQAEIAMQSGSFNLLLDLTEVPYMSSQGLRALHQIYTFLREKAPGASDSAIRAGIAAGTYKSAHLKLFKPTKHVLEVLKMAGYDMFLEIHQHYQQAIDSF